MLPHNRQAIALSLGEMEAFIEPRCEEPFAVIISRDSSHHLLAQAVKRHTCRLQLSGSERLYWLTESYRQWWTSHWTWSRPHGRHPGFCFLCHHATCFSLHVLPERPYCPGLSVMLAPALLLHCSMCCLNRKPDDTATPQRGEPGTLCHQFQ